MSNSTTLAPEEPLTGSSSGRSALIGVILAERIYGALIIDGKVSGQVVSYPEKSGQSAADEENSLVEMPTDSLVQSVCQVVAQLAAGRESQIQAVGLGVPGLLRNGVVEEAPNLPQLKGAKIEALLDSCLKSRGLQIPLYAMNDADAMAAGLAAAHGKLDHTIRVWTLGTGIGFGRYPFAEGVWEGGHTVVTLDERENYCGCGGKGHLEGIMGHRAMRLRFLDMEPEEVFEAANRRQNPDARCAEFKHLWHRALAAATASSIHVSGNGKFYITGYNVRFLDMNLLRQYLKEMVKMSSLQAYSIEVVPGEQPTRILGAAIAAQQMVGRS